MTISNFCVGFVVFYCTACNNRLIRLALHDYSRRRKSFCDIYCLDCIYSWFSSMSDLYFSYESFYLGRCRKDE